MRTKKKHTFSHKPQLNLGSQNVVAHSIATDSRAIAKGEDGIVIFVKDLLPGEKALVKIVEQKATYKKAVISKLESQSAHRVTPKCPYYSECGGCQIQHINPEYQAQYKINWFLETLKRVGKWDTEWIDLAQKKLSVVYLKNEYYRRRIRLHFNGKDLGFRQSQSHHIINIEHCLTAGQNLNKNISVLKQKLNSIFSSLRGKAHECEIEVTQDDDSRIIYHLVHLSCADNETKDVFIKTFLKDLDIQRDQLITLHHPQIGKFKIKKESFVQPHMNCIESYYNKMKFALHDHMKKALKSNKYASKNFTFWDLYAGSGVFTSLGHFVGVELGLNIQCTGVDGVAEAIESLKHNHKDLPIAAKTQDVSQFLDEQFQKNKKEQQPKGQVDIVCLDPPRTGAGIENMQKIVELCRKNALVMYLACDAASFARDTQILLEGGFHLSHVTVFDAFAQTIHYEILGCFERYNTNR